MSHAKEAGSTPRPASGSGVELVGPGGEEVSHRCDQSFGGWQIRVAEAGQAAEHLREDAPVEAPIDFGGLSEEIFLREVLRELEDVGEVASLGPVEQGNDLAARQLTGCESRADEAGGGWVLRWGVQRQVDQ